VGRRPQDYGVTLQPLPPGAFAKNCWRRPGQGLLHPGGALVDRAKGSIAAIQISLKY
jgi:hypothetical protein